MTCARPSLESLSGPARCRRGRSPTSRSLRYYFPVWLLATHLIIENLLPSLTYTYISNNFKCSCQHIDGRVVLRGNSVIAGGLAGILPQHDIFSNLDLLFFFIDYQFILLIFNFKAPKQ